MINIIKAQENNIWEKGVQVLKDKLEKANREGKRSLLFLSGGSAVFLYLKLAEILEKLEIRSDNLAVSQVDERFQPEISENINAKNIEETGLIEKLSLKKIPFYQIPQSGTLRETAFNFDKLLKKLFGIYNYKIAVLGIGKDGHTAGLLRGYKSEWNKDRFAVGFENRGAFKERITITPKVFAMLDYGLVCVSGIEKREMVERILNKASDDVNNLPGLLIHKIKEADLVRDI